MKMGLIGRPEMSVTTKQRCITSQKNEEFTTYRMHFADSPAPRNDHKQYMEFDIIYSAMRLDGQKQWTALERSACSSCTSLLVLNEWVYLRKCALTATYFTVTPMMFSENKHWMVM